MTRIIAGTARGRRLAVPPGRRTRPTSDRAREGLFSTLTSLRGTLTGAWVLDLYAGSGAIGLEALSRGAARAVFVESDPAAARVIRANLDAVGLRGGELITGQVARVLAAGPGPAERPRSAFRSRSAGRPRSAVLSGQEGQAGQEVLPGPEGAPGQEGHPGHEGHPGPERRFDVVVADPPYAAPDEEITTMLAALRDGGWLEAGAVVAVERASRHEPFSWPAGYQPERSRKYGEAVFWYGLAAST